MQVKAWKEKIIIPTYQIGEPDKNPMFLEKRVYQGSSGVVYPHPVIDKVYDEKKDKEYTALYLENEYIKVMILPEMGGRIQMAYDKTNDYHFIYHNSVIKPALVGLAGPWISGGIEFNWPQHHRPSTFDATDYAIEDNADGSKTVWVNEYEIMFRTKCALGFTLYPDKAYIELHAKLYNRTPFPQTFLWWANPAVAVDEHYQSVFPPDVNAVFDHGKRDVSSFPIATGTYYKIDYYPGTDISRYTNIPVPTSYMAVNSEYNFVGGYHHQKKAGMVHVANHHFSPGKKQWTWGCGEFGKAWDRQLTDTDGPYFELMCGVFTDNQPDFSWIMPNEAREFKQYFMPYKNAGYLKNASVDAMCNLEIEKDTAQVNVYVTKQRIVTISLECEGKTLLQETVELSPVVTFEKTLAISKAAVPHQNYYLKVTDEQGTILIDYTPVVKKEEAIPQPATAIPLPADVKTVEDLYLAGLHLEQYRHATYNAEDYYKEALRREPTDVRNNNALGLLYLRRGEYSRSETFFQTAVDKMYKHNPNPYNGEPLYNLGLSLKAQQRYKEAETAFYKSTWNAAMQDNAFLQIAQIAALRNNWSSALEAVEKSLNKNIVSLKARHLKAIALRKLNRLDAAKSWIDESIRKDQFDFGSHYELYNVLTAQNKKEKAGQALQQLQELMRNNSNSYIEIAIDYANAGEYATAFTLLQLLPNRETEALLACYLGYYAMLSSNHVAAEKYYAIAAGCNPDKVFPNRLEDIDVLQAVVAHNKKDYKAYYYLGNFYYAKRRYEDAKNCWEKSVAINDGFATVLRNLGIAYFNKFNNKEKALTYYEKAFICDATDSRVLFELDQLYKRFNKAPEKRLAFLHNYKNLISERDDLYLEYILLHSITGEFEKANELLKARNFHPWEGGEGKTSGQHIHIHVELAKQARKNNQYEEALSLLQKATMYPENLGEGKLHGAQENDIHYWMACAYNQINEKELATECWLKASVGLEEPTAAIFYNDQQPDKIFYQGLALLKLGREEEANKRFYNLIRYGKENMNKEVRIDYFAVSLPDLSIFDDDLNLRNNIHCNYLLALGHLGLHDFETAQSYFQEVLRLDAAHLGAITHKNLTKNMVTEKAETKVQAKAPVIAGDK
jgi:tetratricopeptide (TPR) repeat protein